MNTPTATSRLVIVGATGMVRGYAWRNEFDRASVRAVTAVDRRKLGISHPAAGFARAFHLLARLHRLRGAAKELDFDYLLFRPLYPPFGCCFPTN
jgi:hypothetical protein